VLLARGSIKTLIPKGRRDRLRSGRSLTRTWTIRMMNMNSLKRGRTHVCLAGLRRFGVYRWNLVFWELIGTSKIQLCLNHSLKALGAKVQPFVACWKVRCDLRVGHACGRLPSSGSRKLGRMRDCHQLVIIIVLIVTRSGSSCGASVSL
jgi:hypothetical protein